MAYFVIWKRVIYTWPMSKKMVYLEKIWQLPPKIPNWKFFIGNYCLSKRKAGPVLAKSRVKTTWLLGQAMVQVEVDIAEETNSTWCYCWVDWVWAGV